MCIRISTDTHSQSDRHYHKNLFETPTELRDLLLLQKLHAKTSLHALLDVQHGAGIYAGAAQELRSFVFLYVVWLKLVYLNQL